jgi:co-chaperonin GroES (HSP10)
MHNSNLIQVSGYVLPDVSPSAFGAVSCLPGKVVVEMSEAPDRVGRIYLPDRVSGRLRCDVGVVIGCCAPRDRRGRSLEMDIKPGDAVLVRPYHGAWFDGFSSGAYSTERQVRFFGVHGDPSLYQASEGKMGERSDTGVYELVHWSESVVARLVGELVVPTTGNLLISVLGGQHEFLSLPDGVRLPSQTAVVVAPGPSEFKRGERVAFVASEDDLAVEFGEDLRLVRVSQIVARV